MKKQQKIDLLSELEAYIQDAEDEVKVIPTGIASLDISLGIKGIPLGKFIEIYGPESIGKTTLALTIANQFLKHDERNVVYCDAEQSLSAQSVSISIDEDVRDRFLIIQPGTLEESLLACEKSIHSGECSLVILDSIGSLSPEVVLKGNLEDRQVGILARMLTTFVHRNSRVARKNNTTFLGINQIRDSIGSYVKSLSTPGGHAWKHSLALRIELPYAAHIKKGEEKIGINTSFVIKKSKLSSPYKSFYFPIIFGKGIDKVRDLLLFSELLGLVTRKGSYYIFEDTNLGLGLENSINFLLENPEILDKLRDKCYNSVDLMSVFADEGVVDEETDS